MKSLPTALTTSQVNDLIAGFPTDPRLVVRRFDDIVTVSLALKDRTVKLLSAATANGRDWHVMAKDGIVSTTFTN
jgi:hypothetical protein